MQKLEKNTTDHCVLCNVDTGIPKNTNVAYRPHYVEGAGQLCEKCYNSVYGRT